MAKEFFTSLLDTLQKERDLLVYLDLDSTLYDISQRQIQIFREFAEIKAHRQSFPRECEAFAKLDREHMAFYPEDCLRNYGLSVVNEGLATVFYPFWADRFFSNEYLRYDRLEPGAKEFVNELLNCGAHIHYLTGRDVARMGTNTESILRRDGLLADDLIAKEQVELVMKPHASAPDAQFKHDHIVQSLANFDRGVFVDNEPHNLFIVKDYRDRLHLIHYDSFHSASHPVPEHALVLRSFSPWLESSDTNSP